MQASTHPQSHFEGQAKPLGTSLQDVQSALVELVDEVMGSKPSIDSPLAGKGLDSLTAMELRQKVVVHWLSYVHIIVDKSTYAQ
jgi:hypothetical protein